MIAVKTGARPRLREGMWRGVAARGLVAGAPAVLFSAECEGALNALQVVPSECKKVVCRVLSVTAQGGPAHPPAGRAASDYDFTSRSFAPCVGVDEDPVCGSAHCMLAVHWSRKLHGEEQEGKKDNDGEEDVDLRADGEVLDNGPRREGATCSHCPDGLSQGSS